MILLGNKFENLDKTNAFNPKVLCQGVKCLDTDSGGIGRAIEDLPLEQAPDGFTAEFLANL